MMSFYSGWKRVAGRIHPSAPESRERPVAINAKKHPQLRSIVVLDTDTNSTNMAHTMITQACHRAVRSMFPNDFIYHAAAGEYISAGRTLLEQADYVFLAGGNELCADIDESSDWRIRSLDTDWYHNVITLGAGWRTYEEQTPNEFSQSVFDSALHKTAIHSTRDGYTAKKLRNLGFNAVNTACPTMWQLTREHCAEIPNSKAEAALITFTEYDQNREADELLFRIIRRNYRRIYFWPQQYGDYAYAKDICDDRATFIEPSFEALSRLLSTTDVDYIGTRLYAGIRALQFQRRAMIIAIDNRAIEMHGDFDLPVVLREAMDIELQRRLHGNWKTDIKLDEPAIDVWNSQFTRDVLAKSA